MSTAEKNELTFSVLSDIGNVVARKYGLVFTLSDELQPLYKEVGIDLSNFNGDEKYELPLPGTYVIDQNGTIRSAFVSANYKTRMEPSAIIEVLENL